MSDRQIHEHHFRIDKETRKFISTNLVEALSRIATIAAESNAAKIETAKMSGSRCHGEIGWRFVPDLHAVEIYCANCGEILGNIPVAAFKFVAYADEKMKQEAHTAPGTRLDVRSPPKSS